MWPLAIQLAKFSGFSPIIVTASLKHSNRLKEYGADKVIDRHVTFDVLREEVTSATSRPIEYILDAVSMPETQQLANDILTPGGYLQIVQPPKASFSPDKYIGFTKGIREYPENQQAFERLYGNLFDLLEKEVYAASSNWTLKSVLILASMLMFSRALLKSYQEGLLVFHLGLNAWRTIKFLVPSSSGILRTPIEDMLSCHVFHWYQRLRNRLPFLIRTEFAMIVKRQRAVACHLLQ
jgi:hypothetical protein